MEAARAGPSARGWEAGLEATLALRLLSCIKSEWKPQHWSHGVTVRSEWNEAREVCKETITVFTFLWVPKMKTKVTTMSSGARS